MRIETIASHTEMDRTGCHLHSVLHKDLSTDTLFLTDVLVSQSVERVLLPDGSFWISRRPEGSACRVPLPRMQRRGEWEALFTQAT